MTLAERIALLQTTLAAFLPDRVVTRDLQNFADRPAAELAAGVFTIVVLGEANYSNYRGGEADDGTLTLQIVGQIELAESAPGDAIDGAEFAMVEEMKAFVRTGLVPGIDSLILTRYKQSGQLERPYGWILADLEMMT